MKNFLVEVGILKLINSFGLVSIIRGKQFTDKKKISEIKMASNSLKLSKLITIHLKM